MYFDSMESLQVWRTYKYACGAGKPLNIIVLWLFLLCKAAFKATKKEI